MKSVKVTNFTGRVILNPSGEVVISGRERKPVSQITDRAKRYRAQRNISGDPVCAICGATGRMDVMHLDGNESHGERKNLAYGCRSCNSILGRAFRALGAGVPTRQYNPASGSVPSYNQYVWAVTNQRHSGEHGAAGKVIHATPKHKRIEYARRMAANRRKRRVDEVPF